ncbi:hypothetical protein LRB11_10610 [Ectothiorhodospira haloalkaliphila]|uniref:hypothetical protein n=1 Tax=Ectothiorhodospira haloalkaliphila TaxID=421628 RepID=UPI001EE7F7DC|nr:hypothetical protein [Ectothiorhodospira haloalkaliphila]MCG5525380.1 hypothetical protein [Ectothiorhodospira haloalkaliphila]
MRVVEVIAPARLQTHLLEMARTHGAVDAWCGTLNDDGRVAVRMVVLEDERQALLDALLGKGDFDLALGAGLVLAILWRNGAL